MQYASAETSSEPSRIHGNGCAAPLELRVWVEIPFRRSEFPIHRKPSLALGLRHWEQRPLSGPPANAKRERAPSISVEAGILGLLTAFLAAVSLGLLGSGLETMLMWAL
jgi:hypothetical protein